MLPVLIVNWWRYMKVANKSPVDRWARFPSKSVLFFMGPIVLTGIVASIATDSMRKEVLGFLNGLTGSYTVYLNGQIDREPEKIVGVLKGIAPYKGHHSHPTSSIRVDIRGPEKSITLELGRDSGRLDEYWIFYPGSGITSSNEIGRITTTLFDRY
jgi:hypothetical protein